jgi:hypothetical protein
MSETVKIFASETEAKQAERGENERVFGVRKPSGEQVYVNAGNTGAALLVVARADGYTSAGLERVEKTESERLVNRFGKMSPEEQAAAIEALTQLQARRQQSANLAA